MTKASESRRHPLAGFFHPRTVAVIGATEDPSSVGRTITANLSQTSFGGHVFPVNPSRKQVFERSAMRAFATSKST
jgi:acetyltransferase